MNPWAVLILALATVGGIVGYTQYGKLSSLAENLTVDFKARLHSMDFSKVKFAIEPLLKNPTNGRVYILQPYVKIFYKDKEIASSQVNDKILKIEPFAQVDPFTIMIEASYLNLSGVALELINKLRDKNTKVTVRVDVLLNVILGMKEPVPETLKEYGKAYQLKAMTISKDVVI